MKSSKDKIAGGVPAWAIGDEIASWLHWSVNNIIIAVVVIVQSKGSHFIGDILLASRHITGTNGGHFSWVVIIHCLRQACGRGMCKINVRDTPTLCHRGVRTPVVEGEKWVMSVCRVQKRRANADVWEPSYESHPQSHKPWLDRSSPTLSSTSIRESFSWLLN